MLHFLLLIAFALFVRWAIRGLADFFLKLNGH